MRRVLAGALTMGALFAVSASPAFGAASENASCVGQAFSENNQSEGPSPIGEFLSHYNRIRKEPEPELPSVGSILSPAARSDRELC